MTTGEQVDKDLSAKFLDSQKVGAEACGRAGSSEDLTDKGTNSWLDDLTKRIKSLESTIASLTMDKAPVNELEAENKRLQREITELLCRQDRDRAMIERLESRIEILDQSSVLK